MFSVKPNIQQLTALMLKAHITQAVVCPGSRNAAIVHNLQAAGIECYEVTDERSAGFFAIGLIEANGGMPVAVCITSGSAVLNLSPAVSEAYYRMFPLLIITADRPPQWIGQMDGQTLPQSNAYGQMVAKSVSLPEPANAEERWYCNRLINEAFIALQQIHRPVQINVPITEPMFDFTAESLPNERLIEWTKSHASQDILTEAMREAWQNSNRILIVIGQMLPDEMEKIGLLLADLGRKGCIVLAENLSNVQISDEMENLYIGNFDEMLYAQHFETPDLVITIGGHIVSKRLKQHLRKNPPQWHWHISPNGEVADLFVCCTHLIEATPQNLLSVLCKEDTANLQLRQAYQNRMIRYADKIASIDRKIPAFCDLKVLHDILPKIGNEWHLHVANSSMVRNVQLFFKGKNSIHCNRGVNGIEGSVSAAVGYWASSRKPTMLLTGDLSFFYDQNALWNKYIKSPATPLRILVLNNRCGQIFHHLPGLASPYLSNSITAHHETTAEGIAKECGATYMAVSCKESDAEAALQQTLQVFLQTDKSVKILEVFTDSSVNEQAYKEYYHQLKSIQEL